MSTTQTQAADTKKPTSVPVMTRVSPVIDDKIKAFCAQLGYRSKSVFVEQAVIDFIQRLEATQKEPVLPQAN